MNARQDYSQRFINLDRKSEAMNNCPYQSLGDVDRDVVWTAVAQLNDHAISAMAIETPELYYKWCVEAYTAKRKAHLELEFQTALLEKLQRCDPQGRLAA